MEDDTARVIEPPSGGKGNSTWNGLERERETTLGRDIRTSREREDLVGGCPADESVTLFGGWVGVWTNVEAVSGTDAQRTCCDPFACLTVDWYR